jgi:hypothetical protein
MSMFSVFDHRFRGFRVVEIGGVGVLLALALVVYLLKTGAGGERADIDHIQQRIGDEQSRVALLRAEVAKLEQPERLEALSNRYLNLQPIPAAHEIDAQALAAVARGPVAPPKATVATTAGAPAGPDPAKSVKTKTAPPDAVAAVTSADDAAQALNPPQTADADH